MGGVRDGRCWWEADIAVTGWRWVITLYAMLETALYLAFFAAFSAFMANRLYVGFSQRSIIVKGVTYSRGGEPKMYVAVMFMAGWGLLFGLGMCAVVVAASLGY